MKIALIAFLFIFIQQANAQKYTSPLSIYSAKWNNSKYKKCNSAKDALYMTESERELIHILNLVRTDPKLFCETIVKKGNTISPFIDTGSVEYFQTLVTTLLEMEPLTILVPDSLCFASAKCHALSAGAKGYIGHVRQSPQCRKNKHYMGECCDYGTGEPLEILLDLLQDKGVPSLGHRKICLGTYTKIGVSIQRHKTYRHNAVMDFY